MGVRFKIPGEVDDDDDTFGDSELDDISSDEDETTSDDTDRLGCSLSNFMIKQSSKRKNNDLTDFDGFSVNDDGTVARQMRSILALQDVIGMKDDVPFMMEMEKKEQEKKKLASMTPEERIQYEEDQAGDVMAKIKQRQVERKKEDEARKIKEAREAEEWAAKQKEFEERQAKERREKEATAAALRQRELEARKAREQRAVEARKAKEKLEAEAAAAAAAVRETMKKKKEMASKFTSGSDGDNGGDPFGADFSMSSPVFNKKSSQRDVRPVDVFATANGFGTSDDGWGTMNEIKSVRPRATAKDSDDDVSGDSSLGESDHQENKKKKKHGSKSKEEKKSKKKKKKSSKNRNKGDDGTGVDENDEISGESEYHPPQQHNMAGRGRMTTEADQLLPKVLRELFDKTFESDDMDEVAWKPGDRMAVKKAIISSYEIHRSIWTLDKLLPQTEKSRVAQTSLTELIDKQKRQLDAILDFEERLLTSFENGLKEVVRYKIDHGHLDFDKDPTTVNSKLKSFLSKQRNRYRDYKHHESKGKEKYRLNYRHMIRGEDIKVLRDFGVSLSSSSSKKNTMGSSSHKASSSGSGGKSVERQKSGSSDRRASTRYGASAVSSSSASRNRRQSSAM